MSRESYMKPNSHAQKSATEMINTLAKILAVTALTKDAWLDNLFELGCQWAEENGLELVHVTDYEQGYWSQWLHTYLTDDAALLETANPDYLRKFYLLLKEELVRPVKLPTWHRGILKNHQS